MSKDKYPPIYLRQMQAIVFIVHPLFATRAVLLLKLGKLRSRGIFSHTTCLRWLKTVSSTFQDVDFAGPLLPLFIS